MRLCLILCSVLLSAASCAPRVATVPAPPKAAPVDVKPVRESVTRASANVTEARLSSAKADVQLNQAKTAADYLAAAAQVAFVDGIQAGSAEAAALRFNTQKITSNLNEARASLIQISAALSSATNELEASKTEIGTLQAAAAAKEQEEKTFQANLAEANDRITAANKISDQLAVQKSKTIFWRWAAAIAAVIALLLFLARRIFP